MKLVPAKMRKLLLINVISATFVFAGENVVAQDRKFGYFNIEYVINFMPGLSHIDTLLAQYEQDFINQEYQFRLSEYKRDDSTLRADSTKLPTKLYKERRNKLLQTVYILQNWQQYSQQAMQAKQQELMQPFTTKVIKAYQDIIVEEKCTFVCGYTPAQVLLSNNLTISVLKRLGIKVPDELQMQSQASAKADMPGRKQ